MRAEKFAASLKSLGVGPGQFVGLRMARGVDIYTAMLGILKNGCAYVPLDPAFPPDRVAYILNDCKAQLLVCDVPIPGNKMMSPLPDVLATWEHGQILNFPDALEAAARPEMCRDPGAARRAASAPFISPEGFAYAIYTSGSTGRPKGVLIPHRAISVLVAAEQQSFAPVPQDRVYQGFSTAFDASLEEIWLAFATGATLVPCPDTVTKNPDEIPGFLLHNRITIFSTVPTLLSMLDRNVDSVRLLILGGEACTAELLERWYDGKRRLINSYGPTEASVVSHFREYVRGKPLTIGGPLPHYSGFVMDQHQKLLPPGVPGELCLGGPALATGYLNQPELTAKQFLHVAEPITGYSGLVYRTGDLVRYSEAGEVDYLGRIDLQVKIRGYRVELGEIENVLKQADPDVIRQTAVLVHADDGVQRLVAYLLVDEGARLDTSALRERIKVHLAAYMVPGRFVRMAAFPTLPSGKVDRKRLKAEAEAEEAKAQPAAGEGEGEGGEGQTQQQQQDAASPSRKESRAGVEHTIMRVWHKFLATDKPFSNSDDFFELGGNSLLATLVTSELRKSVYHNVSIRDLYSLRTVAALSEEIYTRIQKTAASDAIPQAEKPKLPEPASACARTFCSVVQILFNLLMSYGFAATTALYYTIEPLENSPFFTAFLVLCLYVAAIFIYPCFVVLFKWTIIGRFEEGVHPLWGWYYTKFWVFRYFFELAPLGIDIRSIVAGTPLGNLYLRALGVNIGNGVNVFTDRVLCTDLLSIGDNTTIAGGTSLTCYTIEHGYLYIGRVAIGSNCNVGISSHFGLGSVMRDGSSLGDLSSVGDGVEVPPGEQWAGAPARRSADAAVPIPNVEYPNIVERSLFHILLVGAIIIVISLPFLNLLSVLSVFLWLQQDATMCTDWGCLVFLPLLSVQYVLCTALSYIVLKWLFCGRLKPGSFSIYSLRFVRHWLADHLIDQSIFTMKAAYATLYTPWFMRALGAKVAAGAEISTISAIQPDMLSIGAFTFLADAAVIGPPAMRGEVCTVGPITIGERTFVGNSALLPGGTTLGKHMLVGVSSLAPPSGAEDATNWVGSPAVLLPRRTQANVDAKATFEPPLSLVLLRLFVEMMKILFPAGMVITTIILNNQFYLWIQDNYPDMDVALKIAFAAAQLIVSILGFALMTIALKWIMVGRFKKGEQPLWSLGVWVNEFITSLCENYAFPWVVAPFLGTPFLSWFFTCMGSKIGKNCYFDTTEITEFDLVNIGDNCTINSCTLQTHLFEDRVMKQSELVIHDGASVGDDVFVLYDTVIGKNASLGSCSLLMKGEQLPEGSKWEGIPAEFVSGQKRV